MFLRYQDWPFRFLTLQILVTYYQNVIKTMSNIIYSGVFEKKSLT